jgi:hypothetical protein
MSHLSCDASGQVATTTLRNPPQNRLSVPMLDEFAQALDAIGTSEARGLCRYGFLISKFVAVDGATPNLPVLFRAQNGPPLWSAAEMHAQSRRANRAGDSGRVAFPAQAC